MFQNRGSWFLKFVLNYFMQQYKDKECKTCNLPNSLLVGILFLFINFTIYRTSFRQKSKIAVLFTNHYQVKSISRFSEERKSEDVQNVQTPAADVDLT